MTRPMLRVLGFPGAGAGAATLGRLAGGRDIALGALALLARDDPGALRSAALAGATVDAIDAVSFGAATRRDGLGLAGAIGGLSGGLAAATGLWAASRLD